MSQMVRTAKLTAGEITVFFYSGRGERSPDHYYLDIILFPLRYASADVTLSSTKSQLQFVELDVNIESYIETVCLTLLTRGSQSVA